MSKRRKSTSKRAPPSKKQKTLPENYIEIYDPEIHWEWYDHFQWKRYEPHISKQLEEQYKKDPDGVVTIHVGGQSYKVYLSDMQQENVNTYYSRPIRRRVMNDQRIIVDIGELLKLYEKYKYNPESQDDEMNTDDDDDLPKEGIHGEGIMKFCEEIEIGPEDIDLLVLFWKLGCKRRYFISKDEFITGLAKLGMETLEKLKKNIKKLKNELNDDSKFKDFYVFCFNYVKDPQLKRITVDLAVPTWKLVLKDKYPYIDQWCQFMEEQYKLPVSLDTWKMFLEFVNDPEVESFETFNSVDSAYPSAIDDFVEWMRKKNKEKNEEKKEEKKEENENPKKRKRE